MSCYTLTEDVIQAAMNWDDNVEGNLWWWHAARGAFFLLRDREPFALWEPSKLWHWLSTGTHVRVARSAPNLAIATALAPLPPVHTHSPPRTHTNPVPTPPKSHQTSLPRDHGELVGADSPFVILVHGNCRAVPNAYVSPTVENVSKKDRRVSGINLLPLRGTLTTGTRGSITAAAASAKRVFSGPDLIVANPDNTYLFKHDSLVFVPSRENAAWLPLSHTFPMAKTSLGAARDIPPPPPPPATRSGSPGGFRSTKPPSIFTRQSTKPQEVISDAIDTGTPTPAQQSTAGDTQRRKEIDLSA